MKVAGLLPILISQDEGVGARDLVLIELPAVVDAVGRCGVVVLLLVTAQVRLLSWKDSSYLTEIITINTTQ